MKKEFEDEFLPFLGKVVKIMSEGHGLPLYGRLVALSPQFLTFERKDGRRTLVHRGQVLTIEPVRKQYQEVV
jgi:hypothetical protein